MHLFYRLFTELKDAFTDLKNSNKFLMYSWSKSEKTTGFLWEAQTKTAKKDYFTQNLSSYTFFWDKYFKLSGNIPWYTSKTF